jgi:hypothetical protein
MEVLGGCEIIEIQIIDPHLKHRAKISKDTTGRSKWKYHSNSRAASRSRTDDIT